jgi:hypothetical protein
MPEVKKNDIFSGDVRQSAQLERDRTLFCLRIISASGGDPQQNQKTEI